MSAPRSPSKNLADQATADAFLLKKHGAALDKFEAAIVLMNRTHTKNPRLKMAKTELYKATTVPEFIAATKLFEDTTTRNKRISMGKDLLFAGAKIVSDAEAKVAAAALAVQADEGPAAHAGPAAPAAPAAAPAPAPAPPAPALDVARAKLSAPASLTLLEKTNRVVLAAPPAAAAAFDKLVNFWSGQALFGGAAAAPAQDKPVHAPGPAAEAVKKRPVAEMSTKEGKELKPVAGMSRKEGKQLRQCIDLTFSSDEEDVQPAPKKAAGPAGGIAKPADAAGPSAGGVPDSKLVYGCTYDGQDFILKPELLRLFDKVKKLGLVKQGDIDPDTMSELQTLPLDMGVACLKLLLIEENVVDANDFIVSKAEHFRQEHDLDGPCNVYVDLMQAYDDERTESEDDNA